MGGLPLAPRLALPPLEMRPFQQSTSTLLRTSFNITDNNHPISNLTMASPDADTVSAQPQVVFRPGKKRKIYRQRAEDPDEEAPTTATVSADTNTTTSTAPVPLPPTGASRQPGSADDGDEEEEGLPVAEVLRRRNARKYRLGGVGFHARPFSHPDHAKGDMNLEQGMVLHDGTDAFQRQEESAILGGISTRFAPQTGLVGELVNKNMEEYIESELARRKRLAAAVQQQDGNDEHGVGGASAVALRFDPTLPAAGVPVESQRVLQGRLMEIDLGEEARARTAAATERARRRLQGQNVEEEEESGDAQPKKVRLGPDGKPWRSRNRRDSDAIQRDQLVEEFLSENRLDVYDLPSEEPVIAGDLGEDEEAADDRIAEEFRQQFMDAMSQRHRRRRPAINAKPATKVQHDEYLKGPKLGGSRNARAAMRDKLLKEQEMKKKR
ncbi:hypothetical protein B0H66DRAFT_611804 [Apodospora peruviana]|uniref:Hepatocellular carcinoma-associated antigen 59-domain-containing protein n=1 Tax=Apodospora peruviana TaxID=516989 RepID=A0AAE0ISH8_9PEZI|nr:hypothetical protein B0H66DRAFT_611804 [Apodospora peruviana]